MNLIGEHTDYNDGFVLPLALTLGTVVRATRRDDDLLRIGAALRQARATRTVVTQNIVLALGVKAAVLLASVAGVAAMWEAVFADVGVALLAMLNAMRLIRR